MSKAYQKTTAKKKKPSARTIDLIRSSSSSDLLVRPLFSVKLSHFLIVVDLDYYIFYEKVFKDC